ncbi:hypothetical protein FRC09_017405 [Ceratobasidium sp. 395]|nr:hypothetical protein FRC09_017405 [Ceratobasidium sp. 395]
MPTSTAHSRVFETPELLGIICSVAERQTCTALLRLNQSSFRAAAPFVWNEVTQVTDLLKLIPGVNVPEASQGVTKITLPSFASADFSRFIAYAPYVRSLDIHSSVSVSPWKTLVLWSKQQPLLPHLSSLTVWQENRKDPITKELMWMSIFLTQSLASVHIQASRNVKIRSIGGASMLLNIIVTSSPHIQHLTLPAISEETAEADGEHCLLNLLPDRPAAESLRALSNLHALTTSLWIFRDLSLQALGSLPCLKRLKIFPGSSIAGAPGAVPFEENLFPALEHLCIEGLTWNDMGPALRHQFLLKNLVSLKLVFEHDASSLGSIDTVFLMLEGMDCLIDLDIDLQDPDGHHEIASDGIVLSTLSDMPLVTVRISDTQIFDISQTPFCQIFSSLVELRMPDQYVDLPNFQFFATIPKLRVLGVAFGRSCTIEQVDTKDITSCPSLLTLEITNKKEDSIDLRPKFVKPIARYFSRLFPNVEDISWPRLGIDESKVEYQCLDLLKICMGLICERSNARTSIANQCGWDIANHLLPDNPDFGI